MPETNGKANQGELFLKISEFKLDMRWKQAQEWSICRNKIISTDKFVSRASPLVQT